ncbi:glycosyltransferase family 4 protein [Exiguobacterium sp. USCH10]|uniref:glycosyltransferase family 4 protein n=1 Tax=Exiguobacterium sp. USCH10 TaxID=3024839 RepID=UPI0030B5CC84
MKRHILVISQYFFPETFRINDICKSWVEKGYKVTVITGIPNYPEGKFYEGYSITKKRIENYQGVQIIRLPIFPRGQSKIGLVLNYLSFVVSGYIWSLFSKLNPDHVFIFEVSPMTQALPGVWFAKRKKIPCSIYVQDLWPENVEIVTGIKSQKVLGSIGKMVDYIYLNCSRIFTTSKSFVNAIIDRGVDQDKVTYWPQYAEDVPCEATYKKKTSDELSIIFTGNIGEAQGLGQLVTLAKALKKLELDHKVHFTLVGEGRFKQNLINQINECDVTHMFTFLGRVPSEQVPKILQSHDVALLSLAPDPLFDMTIPAKLQTYLSVGMPILGLVSGESKSIIEEANAGLIAPLKDTTLQLKCIQKLLETNEEQLKVYRDNASDYAHRFFNKDKLMQKMDVYFEKIDFTEIDTKLEEKKYVRK